MRMSFASLAAGAVLLIAAAAAAQDAPPLPGGGTGEESRPVAPSGAVVYPQWNNNFEVNVRLDGTFASQNRASRITNGFADIEWHSGLNFNQRLSLQAIVHLDQVREPTRDGFLRNQAFFLESLYLYYKEEAFTLFAGKYNPAFGTLWSEDLPGIYTTEFTSAYQIEEGIGVGGTYVLPILGYGEHELGASLFMFDNTFVGTSGPVRPAFGAFDTARPGRLHFRDGGPGNTRGPTSFTVTLTGGDMPQLPGVSYNLGFLRFARGSDDPLAEPSRDVYGFVAGMQYTRRLSPELRVIAAAEGAWFWNLNQGEDANGTTVFGRQRLLTVLGALEIDEHWMLSASTTLRTDSVNAIGLPADRTDWLIAAAVEYMPVEGMRLGVGYRAVRETPIVGDTTRPFTSHTFGVRFRYLFAAPPVTLRRTAER
jgi:hypothetical protein